MRIFKIPSIRFLFIVFCSLFFVITSGALAQETPWYSTNPSELGQELKEAKETGEVSGGAYGFWQLQNSISSITVSIAGTPQELAEGKNSGAIASMNSLIAFLYGHRPASTGEWLVYVGNKMGLVTPAYAQGMGYAGLGSLVKIWERTRDLAFFLTAAVLVLIGLAIMMRVKLDPNTVIGIQNALPRMVIALVLIWFSFAISGFLIDLMYLSIFILFGLASGISTEIDQILNNLRRGFQQTNVILLLWTALGVNPVTAPAEAITNIVRDILGLTSRPVFELILDLLPGPSVRGTIGLVASLIIALAVFFALFKVFFALLLAYIDIIIAVIFAPLFIMASAFPGVAGIGWWLRGLIGNLLAFVLTIGMIILGAVLIKSVEAGEQAFIPPLIGGTGAATGTLPALIGLGIILTVPHVVEMAKQLTKVPALQFGPKAAFGAGAGSAWALGRGGFGRAHEFAFGGARRREAAWQESRAKHEALAGTKQPPERPLPGGRPPLWQRWMAGRGGGQ